HGRASAGYGKLGSRRGDYRNGEMKVKCAKARPRPGGKPTSRTRAAESRTRSPLAASAGISNFSPEELAKKRRWRGRPHPLHEVCALAVETIAVKRTAEAGDGAVRSVLPKTPLWPRCGWPRWFAGRVLGKPKRGIGGKPGVAFLAQLLLDLIAGIDGEL